MKKFIKRLIGIFLAAAMIFVGGIETVFAAEAEEQSLEDIIRPQIEAFAKAIDQKDADGKAADAIASHGMFGRGKDLKVGKDHALTALIVNSELAKEYLTMLCADLIKCADELNVDKIYSLGAVFWQTKSTNFYYFKLYDYNPSVKRNKDGEFTFPKDHFKKVGENPFNKSNEYDESLEWIAGGCIAKVSMKTAEVYKNKTIYDINVEYADYFNFSTSSGDGFTDLISGIGALLFKEFTWYSTFDFQIEIPNDCEHSFSEWKVAAEANCTENGREERTCANCGCTDTKETAALGHSFGEWQETKAPTYHEEGEEQRTCSNCGQTETRAVETLEFLLGDVNGDEKVNVLDANIIRKYAAKSIELSEKQLAAADTNGDGSVNVLDANLIRKFAAKIIDSFPIT